MFQGVFLNCTKKRGFLAFFFGLFQQVRTPFVPTKALSKRFLLLVTLLCFSLMGLVLALCESKLLKGIVGSTLLLSFATLLLSHFDKKDKILGATLLSYILLFFLFGVVLNKNLILKCLEKKLQKEKGGGIVSLYASVAMVGALLPFYQRRKGSKEASQHARSSFGWLFDYAKWIYERLKRYVAESPPGLGRDPGPDRISLRSARDNNIVSPFSNTGRLYQR